jgi:hypothetical protein
LSFATQEKKPQDDDEPKGLSLSFATQGKKPQDNDEPPDLSRLVVVFYNSRKNKKTQKTMMS